MKRAIETLFRLVARPSRTLALLLAAVTAGSASLARADYVAGWDFKSLEGGTAWNTFATSMQSEGTDMFSGEEKTVANDAPVSWDAPSGDKSFTLYATVSNIPSGAVPLICWTVPDSSVEVIIGKTANDSNGFATIRNSWANSSSTTTYSAAGQAFSWKADTGEHTLTVVYRAVTSSYTRFYLDGVLITEVSGLLWNDKAHGKIIFGGVTLDGSNTYDGAEATGMVVKRAYYRQGVQYNPNTKTGTLVSNGYTLNLNGCVINSDGTLSIMGAPNQGPTVTFANGDDFYNSKTLSVVMEVDGAPIASSDAMLVNFTYGTNKIGLRTNNGTLYQSWNGGSSNYGKYAWVPGKRQTLTFTADRASDGTRGTRTIIDGTEVIANVQALCADETFRSVQIGSYYNGSAYSQVARGLRIYSIKLYTTKLDAAGAATAATDVIISDGATVEATAGMNGIMYCGSDFTTGFTIDLKGQTVALGTYPGTSGTITVNDSVSGGSATLTIPEGFTGSFAGSGKLSVTAPSSILPSSGGATLPSTVTIPDAAGTVIAANSVTIGNSGIQMAYTTQPITLMMKVEDVPSTASTLAGFELSGKSAEIVPVRTTTGFQNGWVSTNGGNFGNNSGSGWGAASTTSVASGEHWLTVAYASDTNNYGTRSYLDGEGVACTEDPNDLRWSNGALTAVTVGGSKASVNNYTAATGMVIKDVQIYSGKLTAAQVAKAEAAAAAGWTPSDATGLAWSSSEGATLPGASAVTVIGSITIGSDGTLDLSGITQALASSGGSVDLSKASGLTAVSVLSGGTATLGLQRPAQVVVMEGGTLNLTAGTMSDIITGYTPTATLTTQSATMFAGTITLNGQTVTPVIDGATVTLTGTYVAGNPSYTGSSYWWDYEFNGNGNNIGSDATALQWDSGNGGRPTQTGGSAESLGDYTTAVDGNQAVYLLARPWRDVTSYPSEFTAVMYCKAGTTANAVLVSFGSSTAGSKKVIALTTGDDPSQGQMRLVLIDANSGVQTATDLVEGGFTLDNITSSTHLYAFTVKTVDGNSQITVYADGDLLTTYVATGEITLGTGFQVGSIHGSIQNWMGLRYLVDGSNSTTPDTATMDFLRVFEGELTSAAISALAAEYPYVSPNGIATRVVDANGTWSDSENTSWSQKTLNQDGSSTTADQAAPNSGTVVDVIATADATLTMNLDSAVTYEKLTFEGAGAITVVKGGTAPTVTTRTYIKTDTTLPVDAFASLGAITVDDGKTLTLIPAESTPSTALGLGIRGTTSSVVTGTVTLGNGATVALDASTVAAYAEAGISLSLEQNASLQYVLAITRQDGDVTITKAVNGDETATMGGAIYPLPAIPATIPSDFANSVTIVNNNASEFTVATVFNGGAVPVTVNSASAPVVLTGDSTFGGAVSGTATLTISGDITLASGGSIANTIAGAGTITLSALSQTLTFGAWTGTVALPAFTGEAITLNNYGIAGSTVRVSGSAGWLHKDHANVDPNIELGGDWTLPHFSASFANTLAKLSGAYKFTLGASSIEYTDDSQTPYFLIKDVSDFTGSLETSAAGIVLGAASKPTGREHGGKILVYGNVTVGETATWTAPNGVVLMEDSATLTVPSGATVPEVATSVANSYAKAAAGESSTVYSVDGYNTVTFAGANMTATRTDVLETAIKDGDTITFTVAPESGYAVTGVTASSGQVTESNGVYSYTVTENATITVTTVSTAVTFSDVEFDYYVGYGSAKSVTAKVTGQVAENTAWTLTVGGTAYAGGVYDSATGKVTWTPENGIANLTAGQALSYSIAATGGSTGTLANQQTTVGNVIDGWIAEDAAHNGTGTWSPNAPVFGEDDRAALSGETTFTARAQASGKVTLRTVVNFGNDADPTIEIDADAKAAIKVENNSFKIWTKTTSEGGTGATADWLTVSGATPNLAADSRVVVTFDTDAKTFTVSVDGAALYYGESNANTSFAFASDGIAIGSVQYMGTGSFTSLTGEYTTTDIAQTVDGKGVVVANSFISGNEALRAMTIEEATAALAPNAAATCGNGLNYFANYALGLDPTKADDKPIVDVTTDANGNYVFTVKHPVYDAQGVITGYEEINAADNVTTTVTLKYGTDANTQSWESAEGTSFAPNALPFGENNNVLYYKADVTIGAK